MADSVFMLLTAALCGLTLIAVVMMLRRSRRTEALGLDLRMLTQSAERTDKIIRDETARMRNEAEDRGKVLRAEVREQITLFSDSLRAAMDGMRTGLDARLADLSRASADTQEKLRVSVEGRLDTLRKDNEAKLEQMRATVEEKLQGTLEKRLGESFALVSERLAEVHKGLGEMQNLATGVGDLKRVLTNVKARGTWAEFQLGAQLEAMLAPDQFAANVEIVPGSRERVEYAIRMPGGDEGPLWLPIDCKFPKEDYEKLMAAHDAADPIAAEAAGRALEMRVRQEAKRIREKYIAPPASTDFAILYLPTEGLFAEIVRRDALVCDLQHAHRVTVAGPTTLCAFLNSLQMGFRTLAIQKRSSEVWRVLGEAKAEFENYGRVWEKLGKQLDTAKTTVEEAGRRTRAVARKLKDVETLGPADLVARLEMVVTGESEDAA